MSRRVLRAPLAALTALLIATGCNDANAPEGEAPVLPPQSTFVIPFDNFTATPLAAAPMAPTEMAAGTYWNRSALVVGFWNVALTVHLAVPVASFVAAVHQTPAWDDGAWTWSYNFTVLVQHSARLEARVTGSEIQWDMYISREGSYTDFHWYTGVSNLTATEGTWTLYREPSDRTQFIDIEWNRAASGDTYDITYTYVVPGTPEYGGYITHGITGDTPFNAFYDLYAAVGGNLTDIEWNTTTGEGRTRDENYFGDTDWRCWDATQENTACQ